MLFVMGLEDGFFTGLRFINDIISKDTTVETRHTKI